MARKQQKPTPKKIKNRVKNIIERAAEEAAQEAEEESHSLLSFDTNDPDEDVDQIEREFEASTPEETETDIFEDSFRKAQGKNDLPRFWIHKNSEFLCIKEWPYSWTMLQKEYGPGLYKISARSKKGGFVLQRATESIADPNQGRPVPTLEEDSRLDYGPQDWMTMMSALQDKGESKAQIAANQQMMMMTTLMTGITQSQQKSSEQMQLMMMEMQKQSQAQITAAQTQASSAQTQMMTLMIGLLTKKDDEKNKGPDAFTLLKMLGDARKEGKEDYQEFMEKLDKKTEELREELEASGGGGDGEESLGKTLIKGLVPMLAQGMAQQQQQAQSAGPQITPAQQEQLQLEHNQRLMQAQNAEAARRTRIEQEKSRRRTAGSGIAIPGVPQPSVPDTGGPTARLRAGEARSTSVPQNIVESGKPVVSANPSTENPKVVAGNGRKEGAEVTAIQLKIIDVVKDELQKAIIKRKTAPECAELCVKRLEDQGLTRQNVVDEFSLEDLMTFAAGYGVPDAAKPWLTEFYESLEKPMAGLNITRQANGQDPAAPKATGPRKVAGVTGTRARTSAREPAKNL